jgi:4a-hydroxytetrahydrobiopterin dehydratase
MQPLDDSTLRQALMRVPAWTFDAARPAIRRDFAFANFAQAFAFMTELALHAEQHNHHPEWSNVYNRVSIVLTTHDAGGVTDKDIVLAAFADSVAQRFITAPSA